MTIKSRFIIAGIGNLIDAIATYILTQYYGFMEANPVMARFLELHPLITVILKVIVVSTILFYAYRKEHNKYTSILATFAACLYGAIAIYYIVFFTIILL